MRTKARILAKLTPEQLYHLRNGPHQILNPELRNRALEKAQVAQASGTSDGDSSNFGEVGISHANIRSSR